MLNYCKLQVGHTIFYGELKAIVNGMMSDEMKWAEPYIHGQNWDFPVFWVMV